MVSTLLVRLELWLFALTMVVLIVFAPTRENLWAVLAAIGIALGLGAQDLVRNILGGLVILVNRPYQLGDRVQIRDALQSDITLRAKAEFLRRSMLDRWRGAERRAAIPSSSSSTGLPYSSRSAQSECSAGKNNSR